MPPCFFNQRLMRTPSSKSNSIICKNCNNNFSGNFCNSCGQKASVQRIDLNYVLTEIRQGFLQLDNGLFYTLFKLSHRPGHAVREFLEGRRKNHIKPLSYLLITSALYVVLTLFAGSETYLGEFFSGMSESLNDRPLTSSVLGWSIQNFAYVTLLLIPMFSFLSYLLFRRLRYNYFEHLIFNLYITGQVILIHVISESIHYTIGLSHYFQKAIPLFAGFFYTFWSYNQFFRKRPLFSVTTRLIFVYLLYAVSITLIMSIFVVLDIAKGT